MATDYGKDVSTFVLNPDGLYDLDPTFTVTSGRSVVAEQIARRLVTTRGGLSYDPDFGTDLRDWIGADFPITGSGPNLFALTSAVERECEKDERVAAASASATYDASTRAVSVAVGVDLLSGESFSLVLSVTAVSASVLKVST